MTLELQLSSLWPVLGPLLGALLVLVLDVLRPRDRVPHLVVTALALAGGAAGTLPGLLGDDPARAFCLPGGPCLYAAGSVASGVQLLVLAGATVALVLTWGHWARLATGRTPVLTALLLAATGGLAAVPAAADLATLLVALELATLPAVLLVALEQRPEREAGAVGGAVTLLMTAVVSFAVTAMGVALWVAATGTAVLTPGPVVAAAAGDGAALLWLGAATVVAGVGFKLSAVPFHVWTPVTYVTAPLPVTVFLAGASKAGALGALLVVVRALAPVSGATLVVIGLLAAVSMTLGNLLALREQQLVRLLAWSAVAQTGWLLLPLAVVSSRAERAAAGYLAVYVVATLLAFVVVAAVAARPGRGVDLEDHRWLGREHPVVAAVLGLALLALAGLPPAVVGLVAKVVALRPVAGEGMWWLAVVAAVNVALGIAVYLRWLAVVVSRWPVDEHGREVPRPAPAQVARTEQAREQAGSEPTGSPEAALPEAPPRWSPAHLTLMAVLAGLLVAGSIAPVGVF